MAVLGPLPLHFTHTNTQTTVIVFPPFKLAEQKKNQSPHFLHHIGLRSEQCATECRGVHPAPYLSNYVFQGVHAEMAQAATKVFQNIDGPHSFRNALEELREIDVHRILKGAPAPGKPPKSKEVPLFW
jgi:hypothetical protein